MRLNLNYPKGATPIDPDEMKGLKLDYITTQRELNAAEQNNLIKGTTWAFAIKRKNVLSEKFLRGLHKKLFGEVWAWAGVYRKSNKTIGVEWFKIPEEIKKLIDDTRYWIENETYPMEELAARFHHRLVWIHPFANGNGRFSRICTDVLMESLDQKHFSWGSENHEQDITDGGKLRERYIHALQMADGKAFKELVDFMKS